MAVGEGGKRRSGTERLEEERLELLLLGNTLNLEETLASMKNTDPVEGSAFSAHKSSSILPEECVYKV